MLNLLSPLHEAARLENLRTFDLLDTPAESAFDDLTLLASKICATPISLISLIDAERQWFKSRVGLAICQTPREIGFCPHAILRRDLLVVEDACRDERFAGNPLVTGEPYIRFYAGTPLISREGQALGTLCVIDRVPRQLSAEQIEALRVLGRQVVTHMELRRALAASGSAERFANSTVDALTAHIAILDESGTIIRVNRAWREFAANNAADGSRFSVGANYLEVCQTAKGLCSEEASAVAAGITEVLTGTKDLFTLEYPCHSPTEKRWFVARVSRFSSDGPTRVVVAHENVTVRRLAEDRLRHDSLHDALTGLPNRVLFSDRIQRSLERSRRDPSHYFAVLFMDLDRFKVINDSLGHAAGDAVLTAIAQRLSGCLRGGDAVGAGGSEARGGEGQLVARMGGDEFTVLLEGLRSPVDAARVAERILAEVQLPILFDGHELTTTASIGIVSGSDACDSARDLLRDADAAMYQAKASGKARYVVYDTTLHTAAVSRLELENDLRRAVERGELLLHYQPILTLRTRQLEGFEALVRWNRGGRLIPPAEFIPIAEDIGLIGEIGAWVLEEACRQLFVWKSAYYGAQKLSINVNVSGRQLADPQFVGRVRQCLGQTRIDPASVKLEITESVIIEDGERTLDVLRRLKETGVQLVMDDFGTGYSSLSSLHRFPIDLLKVDRSFVKEMRGRRDAAVVKAIVGLAHNLGMKVVAEGLERVEQAVSLQELECDLGQGFLFAPGLDATSAARFLSEPAERAATG